MISGRTRIGALAERLADGYHEDAPRAEGLWRYASEETRYEPVAAAVTICGESVMAHTEEGAFDALEFHQHLTGALWLHIS